MTMNLPANIIRSTQLQSLAAMVNAASVGGTLHDILQCVEVTIHAPPPSPLGFLGIGQVFPFSFCGGSSTEVFLCGKYVASSANVFWTTGLINTVV